MNHSLLRRQLAALWTLLTLLTPLTMSSAGALAIAGCSRAQTAQARSTDASEKKVKVAAVLQEPVRRAVEVVGTLAAQEEVTISSEADGTVAQILADLGDHVRAGQPLIELDREKAQYKLDQQKAAHDQALAKYGAASANALPSIEQTPDVQRAAAELAQAEQGLARAKELRSRQLLPQQQLDDAEAAQKSKKASYESSLQNAKNLKADIDAAEASMKLADRALRDATIRAPFDGYVQKRMVSMGELVKAQAPVISVVRVDPLKVTAEIPERMAPWIAVGQPVELKVDAFADKPFTGRVTRISPAVNPQTRAFPFEASVPNGDGRLKPGTFARVHLETSLVDQVLTLPYAAMQYRYGVNRVFVVKDGRLSARELKVGDRSGDRIEIIGGVESGERVSMTDVDKLTDGMKVKVAE
jgi:multidrug efflux pump subunit AcrA (membrane-fusion protein)